jgi:glyoxylase-like metal-dependent hydrolase (beta-lactamase superfamily II)
MNKNGLFKIFLVCVASAAMACSSLHESAREIRERSQVIQIDTGIANVYAIRGDRTVLVDTSAPGKAGEIEESLRELGVDISDVALIVLTHGHADHCGSTGYFQKTYGIPVLGGAGDVDMFARGSNRGLTATGVLGQMVKPFVDFRHEGFQPDFTLKQGEQFDLRPYGVVGRVEVSGGHTQGSLAILLESREAIVGDLLRGSLWNDHAPTEHFFHEDGSFVRGQLQRLVDGGYRLFYTGHFGPVDAEALRSEFKLR